VLRQYESHNPADNIVLAIYRDAAGAQKALDASPIRFALESVVHQDTKDSVYESQHQLEDEHSDTTDRFDVRPQAKGGIDEILRPSTLTTRTEPSAVLSPKTPAQPPMPFDPPEPPPIIPQHTKTTWFQVTVDRSRSVHQDYVERQPFWKQYTPMKSMSQEDLAKKVPHIGLSDISKRPFNAHRTPNRVLKQMSEYVETRMPGLRSIAEESERDKAFRERRGIGGKPKF
jgi:hypothetical protein